eukprot:7306255-Prymnesium_polylepis.1
MKVGGCKRGRSQAKLTKPAHQSGRRRFRHKPRRRERLTARLIVAGCRQRGMGFSGATVQTEIS